MKRRLMVIGLAIVPTLAAAQPGPVLVDSAEVYCTDAARPGLQSMGVHYNRTMPDHFAQGLRFCRLDMTALAGPVGGAEAGWRHDAASGQTALWCRAQATNAGHATVRMRFALYALPPGADGTACTPARDGRLP